MPATIQLVFELRCVVCDSVLIVNGVHVDKHGCFACIEPCENCSKLTKRVPDRLAGGGRKHPARAVKQIQKLLAKHGGR